MNEEKDLPEGEEKDWSELRPVRIMVGEEEEKLLGGTVTVMVEEDEIALGGPVTVRPDEEKGLPEDKQLVHDTKAESGCAMPFDAQEATRSIVRVMHGTEHWGCGFVVAEEYVITAAHCLPRGPDDSFDDVVGGTMIQ